MTAVELSEYGSVDDVVITGRDGKTAPEAGRILVKVAAASVNPVDSMIAAGYFSEMLPLELPVTLGGDFSGVVEEVGRGVDQFVAGDRVIGHASVLMGGPGTFADYVVAPAGMTAVAPTNLDRVDAAGLPLAGASALQALDSCRLSSGQIVLVLGGGGAVGSIAVQAARAAGLRVYASSNVDDYGYLTALGAESVFDYKDPSWLSDLSDIDAVLDASTGVDPKPYYAVLKPGGVMVSLATQHAPGVAAAAGVEASYQMTAPSSEVLDRLVSLVNNGLVRQRISGRYPMAEFRLAFKSAGKNLIVI